MQKQNMSLRRSVERKVPGYVRVIVALLYAATLLFTILGAMFGILFMPLALGSLFGGWYLMGEARVIYEYRLDGRTLTVMRTSGMHLKTGLKPILEFESGSNDPMAVLLSMGAITILTADSYSAAVMLSDFVLQMAIGLGLGLAVGFGVGRFLQKWCLVYQGLYPVFGVGVVLVTFSLTQLLHGNGFLAVYLCGIVLGNTPFMYRRHLIRFQDSLAWIMQIGMFLILGLLVNPHEFNGIMLVSFACSLALMFVARPAAVFICLFKSGYTLNEKLFISWAGLKGAVPIILATYPLMERFPNSQFLFNLIFFLVIISVLFQGKTLAPLARRLKLEDRN